MSGVNVNISVSGLPHYDRHQDNAHQKPIINQQQNAQIVNSEITQRISRPVEVDHAEGKIIDGRQKITRQKSRKRKKLRSSQKEATQRKDRHDDGHFVDIQA